MMNKTESMFYINIYITVIMLLVSVPTMSIASLEAFSLEIPFIGVWTRTNMLQGFHCFVI